MICNFCQNQFEPYWFEDQIKTFDSKNKTSSSSKKISEESKVTFSKGTPSEKNFRETPGENSFKRTSGEKNLPIKSLNQIHESQSNDLNDEDKEIIEWVTGYI